MTVQHYVADTIFSFRIVEFHKAFSGSFECCHSYFLNVSYIIYLFLKCHFSSRVDYFPVLLKRSGWIQRITRICAVPLDIPRGFWVTKYLIFWYYLLYSTCSHCHLDLKMFAVIFRFFFLFLIMHLIEYVASDFLYNKCGIENVIFSIYFRNFVKESL